MAAKADLVVDITRGVADPVVVAVVPFEGAIAQVKTGPDVAAVVQRDLESSGRFRGVDRSSMPAQPHQAKEVDAVRWRGARADYIVVGRVAASGADVTLAFELVNVLTGQTQLSETVTVPQSSLRNGAHRVADRVFERLTGVHGAFATRIAYVSVDGQPPKQRYQLLVADADGENFRVALQSDYPIMSPAWSADGEWLAYVSFEDQAAAVFVQRVRTGERRRVSARAGHNGAPAFSPDGTRLALVLGGSAGNYDIYILDLASQQLTRITDNPAIDTEPAWSPDGQLLYFNSDRGGAPQIYAVAARSGAEAKRISFRVPYAARPRVSPDGKQLALMIQDGNVSRIALLDLASGEISPLSLGALDESPSFAPNGATLIYAGRDRGQGVLATISADGQVGLRLKSDQGEVREPVWGPFTN